MAPGDTSEGTTALLELLKQSMDAITHGRSEGLSNHLERYQAVLEEIKAYSQHTSSDNQAIIPAEQAGIPANQQQLLGLIQAEAHQLQKILLIFQACKEFQGQDWYQHVPEHPQEKINLLIEWCHEHCMNIADHKYFPTHLEAVTQALKDNFFKIWSYDLSTTSMYCSTIYNQLDIINSTPLREEFYANYLQHCIGVLEANQAESTATNPSETYPIEAQLSASPPPPPLPTYSPIPERRTLSVPKSTAQSMEALSQSTINTLPFEEILARSKSLKRQRQQNLKPGDTIETRIKELGDLLDQAKPRQTEKSIVEVAGRAVLARRDAFAESDSENDDWHDDWDPDLSESESEVQKMPAAPDLDEQSASWSQDESEAVEDLQDRISKLKIN